MGLRKPRNDPCLIVLLIVSHPFKVLSTLHTCTNQRAWRLIFRIEPSFEHLSSSLYQKNEKQATKTKKTIQFHCEFFWVKSNHNFPCWLTSKITVLILFIIMQAVDIFVAGNSSCSICFRCFDEKNNHPKCHKVTPSKPPCSPTRALRANTLTFTSNLGESMRWYRWAWCLSHWFPMVS